MKLKPGQIIIDDLELPFEVVKVTGNKVTLLPLFTQNEIEVPIEVLEERGWVVVETT